MYFRSLRNTRGGFDLQTKSRNRRIETMACNVLGIAFRVKGYHVFYYVIVRVCVFFLYCARVRSSAARHRFKSADCL